MTDIDNKILEDFKKILERKDIDNLKQHYVEGRTNNKKEPVSLMDFLKSVEMHDTIYGFSLENKETNNEKEIEYERD